MQAFGYENGFAGEPNASLLCGALNGLHDAAGGARLRAAFHRAQLPSDLLSLFAQFPSLFLFCREGHEQCIAFPGGALMFGAKLLEFRAGEFTASAIQLALQRPESRAVQFAALLLDG